MQLPAKLSRLREGIGLELLIGLSLKMAGAVTSFGLNLLISRQLGAEGVGIFQIALTTAAFAAVGATLGLDTMLVRSVSVSWRKNARSNANAATRKVLRIVASTGLISGVLVALGSIPVTLWVMEEPQMLMPLLIMSCSVPFLAIIRVLSSAIRGTGNVLTSQSLDGVSYTGLAAIAFSLAILLANPQTDLLPIICYVGATLLVALVGWRSLKRLFCGLDGGSTELKLLSGRSIAIMVLLVQFIDWAAIFMLGATSGLAEAGIYRIAAQYCLLFTLINNSFAQMAGPHLANMYAESDFRGMLITATRVGFAGFAVGLPLFIGILVFPEYLMLLFGEQFGIGAQALVILAAGRFVSVCVGPMGTLLIMARRENITLGLEILSASSAALLLFLLVPLMSLTGAAIAVLSAALLRNVGSLVAAWTILGRMKA